MPVLPAQCHPDSAQQKLPCHHTIYRQRMVVGSLVAVLGGASVIRRSRKGLKRTWRRWRVELAIRRLRQAGVLGALLSQVLSGLLVLEMATVCGWGIEKDELDQYHRQQKRCRLPGSLPKACRAWRWPNPRRCWLSRQQLPRLLVPFSASPQEQPASRSLPASRLCSVEDRR